MNTGELIGLIVMDSRPAQLMIGGGLQIAILGQISLQFIGLTQIYLILLKLNIYHCSIKRGDKRNGCCKKTL
jgi:hypothetical protein